ncbi:hypothetical protein [Jeongeupia sp. USM3]|uniref:hypothetical protein n=1 Tax=Jeongeupia sp. USM3 TaxID=1906741 RepID=UPI0011AB6CAB|nr:hypothetical protein [Jeongeupia sp. USM3]
MIQLLSLLSTFISRLIAGMLLMLGLCASAQAALVTCTGSAADSYTPGITQTAQTVQVDTTSTYSQCTSLLPLWNGSAVSHANFPFAGASCLSLLGVSTGTMAKTINWSDGTSSTWSGGTSTVNAVEGSTVIVRVAPITDGRYLGRSVVETKVYLNTDLNACSTSGMSSLNGTAELLIL